MSKVKRHKVRVKLPIRQAVDMEATFANVRQFCGMHGASAELMDHVRACEQNIKQAIAHRNRVAGIEARHGN